MKRILFIFLVSPVIYYTNHLATHHEDQCVYITLNGMDPNAKITW